jgi:hypothetical protein
MSEDRLRVLNNCITIFTMFTVGLIVAQLLITEFDDDDLIRSVFPSSRRRTAFSDLREPSAGAV